MRRIATALAALACLATPAGAADFVLGVESDLRFDDNVYGTTRNEIADGYWTIAPTFESAERWKTLSAELNFTPTYELFFDEEDVNGFNYDADGTVEWKPTERTTVSLFDDFRRYRSLRDLDTGGAVGSPRERFNQNIAQFSITHRTSERGTVYLSGSHTLWEFEGVERVDQRSGGAALRYDYLVTPRTRMGGALQFSRQNLYPESGLRRHSDYYNASLTVSYVPAATFLVRGSVGPTLVRQPKPKSTFPDSVLRRDVIRRAPSGAPEVGLVGSCPLLPTTGEAYDDPSCDFVVFPFPSLLQLTDPIPVSAAAPNFDGGSWTYFADLELQKEWEQARLTASYRRDQGANSALGFTTLADTISLHASWRPLQKLSLYGNVAWEDREQSEEPGSRLTAVILLDTLPTVANLVPVGVRVVPAGVGSKASVRTLSVSFGGDYVLFPALKLEAMLGWSDQDATPGSGFSDTNRFWMRVGLDFEYGPIRW